MKRNIITGVAITLFSLCSISCNNNTTDDTTDVSDTMTMPAGSPADTSTNNTTPSTNSTPPAVVDTTRTPDSMPSR